MAIKRFKLLVLCLLAAALAGCVRGDWSKAPVTVVNIAPEDTVYRDLVWLPDGTLWILDTIREGNGTQWVARTLDGETLIPLALPEDTRCAPAPIYSHPTLLPDGRIGFLEECPGRWDDLSGNPYFIVAYDPKTRTSAWLSEWLPSYGYVNHPDSFTWNPQMTQGVQWLRSDAGTLYWISRAGYSPMKVEVKSDPLLNEPVSWRLDEAFEVVEDYDETSRVGLAGYPAWSPDGSQIAFLAAPGAIGLKGPPRYTNHWNLYLIAPDDSVAEPAVVGLRSPYLIQWSPDSAWLLIVGQMGGPFSDLGFWLYSPAKARTILVAKGLTGSAVWSPDGTQIAFKGCETFSKRFDTFGNCIRSNVQVLEVGKIVGEEE